MRYVAHQEQEVTAWPECWWIRGIEIAPGSSPGKGVARPVFTSLRLHLDVIVGFYEVPMTRWGSVAVGKTFDCPGAGTICPLKRPGWSESGRVRVEEGNSRGFRGSGA